MWTRHISLAAVAGLLAGCPGLGASTSYGEPMEIGDGIVQSFLITAPQGEPETFGLTWTASFASLPPAGMTPPEEQRPVPLPAGATDLFPVDHLMFEWLPQGHEPAGVYDRPHLDIHFYLISVDERMRIEPGDCQETSLTCEALLLARKLPPAHATPAGYSAVDAVAPWMGNHLVDLNAPEFTGGSFTHAFLYGSWDGQLAFLEPMLAQSWLESLNQEECRTIPTPEVFPVAGWYPSSYCVGYDSRTQSYTLTLQGFERYAGVPPVF